MTLPAWLRSPDPDLDPDYLRRARYSYASMVAYNEADRPIILNANTPYAEPLDMDTAILMFERMAQEYLK